MLLNRIQRIRHGKHIQLFFSGINIIIMKLRMNKAISAYRNTYFGKRIFIIGNGPSLNDIDMTRLQNEYTFSFNRAYIAYKDWKFIPSFYSCIDKVVLPDNVNEINEMIKDNRFKDVLFFFPHWAEQFLLKREHVLFLKHIPGVKTFEENIQKFETQYGEIKMQGIGVQGSDKQFGFKGPSIPEK